MTFKNSIINLEMDLPPFPVSVGDRLKAVIRPESIDIFDKESPLPDTENIIQGRIESAMYIGSIMRYTVSAGEHTVYVDESDPQYRGILQEGSMANLIFKKRVHMLRE